VQGWRLSGGLVAACVGLGLFLFPIGGGLERASFDLPFALRGNVPQDKVVIVYLDEMSHAELNQPYAAPWDRAVHARLLDKLKEGGARLVVFDILFDRVSEQNPASDRRLVQAIANHGNVVLAADYAMSKSVQGVISSTADLPAPLFSSAAAAWGNAKLLCDPDYGVREHFPNLRTVPGHTHFQSLAWASARAFGAATVQSSKAENSRRYLNYYGPPGTLPSVSYFLPFVENALPTDFFRDKVVYVGSQLSADFSGKGKDEFATPYTRWHKGFAPGVEVHATMFLNLVRGDWLIRLPWGIELGLLLGSGVLSGWLFMRSRPLIAAGAALGAMIAVGAIASALAYHAHVWFAWGIVVVQVPVALGWTLLVQLVQARIEQAALKRSLSLHLSAHRVEQILTNHDILTPGAEEKEVSIIFTDIANYSKIMQRGMLGQMVPLMNDYFEVAIGCVHERDGTVIKLIGDAVFAIWNAPQPQENHADLACKAAVLLRERLNSFDARQKALFSFRTRVGLHTEKVFVGNFGSRERFDYTAMGNGVNLAARLEGANKTLGTETLVSDEFASRLRDTYTMRQLGQFRFKGFDHVVTVHELIGGPELAEIHREWISVFSEALAHFKNRRFATAEAGFQKTIELRKSTEAIRTEIISSDLSDDGPSRFYLSRIPLLSKAVTNDWLGEVSLDEK